MNNCDQLEIKTQVSAEAAELFLYLEVFICRILVPVDLHIRDMPLLRCSCLIDLDEALPEMPMSCCVISHCIIYYNSYRVVQLLLFVLLFI